MNIKKITEKVFYSLFLLTFPILLEIFVFLLPILGTSYNVVCVGRASVYLRIVEYSEGKRFF